MEAIVTRIVERRFPELASAYHLPKFARVTAVADPPVNAGICDEFRPRYAVDLELLGPDGEPDATLPPMLGVPLPVPAGGTEAGFFGFPEEGTTVVVSFAYGLPNKPFVLQVLPHGLSLPRLPKGDQLWQHSDASQQRVDADGNWVRQTDGDILDRSTSRKVEALDNQEAYQGSEVTVEDHSTERIGGVKVVEALGALKLLSGGSASFASVDDMHQASGRDLNQVVGQTLNATVGSNMTERVQGLRSSISRIGQRLQSPRTWIGSEQVNVLQVLSSLLDLVEQMNLELAEHTHGATPVPSNAGAFGENAVRASGLSVTLKSITM